MTRMDAGLHVFEISGPSLPGLIVRAVTVDPAKAGPSAALTFVGIQASVYRHLDEQTLRVHLDRGHVSTSAAKRELTPLSYAETDRRAAYRGGEKDAPLRNAPLTPGAPSFFVEQRAPQ